MCELLVGLPDVDVVAVDDPVPGWLVVTVVAREARPGCGRCGCEVGDHLGGIAVSKERRSQEGRAEASSRRVDR